MSKAEYNEQVHDFSTLNKILLIQIILIPEWFWMIGHL